MREKELQRRKAERDADEMEEVEFEQLQQDVEAANPEYQYLYQQTEEDAAGTNR